MEAIVDKLESEAQIQKLKSNVSRKNYKFTHHE